MVGSVFTIPQQDLAHANPDSALQDRGPNVPKLDGASLDHFVAGPENALTQLAEASVSDEWQRFNPLFITGAVGLGKTHLLRCLAVAALARNATLTSLQINGADYARAISDAIELDTLSELRVAHRSVNLLMLDGLHELVKKKRAQQELLHTIDVLTRRGGQVVVTSRLTTDKLTSILPGLASRLAAGLHIPLAAPSSATRDVILSKLANQRHVRVPESVRSRLVQDFSSTRSVSTRDLEFAVAELQRVPDGADIEMSPKTHDDPSTKQIIKLIAKAFSVTVRELTGPSRRKTVVRARAAAVYLIREVLHVSFQNIGRDFSGRDHSTTMHAYNRAGEWLENDAQFASVVAEVRSGLE